MRRLFALAAFIAGTLSACDSFGQAVSSHTDLVARAAGHELTADATATLVAPHREVPAQREVIDAIANLWVDYTLLATAATQDSTLGNVDLEPLLKPYRDQAMVWKLREKVISVDTVIRDEDLRRRYDQEQLGLEVRARHILLRMPEDATPAVRDSVMREAQQIRDRAAGGEDFATLARVFSQDGAAQQGGDLGFMARGAMIAPFEEVAFALEPGAISDVVETPFGLHIIKVEERRQPSYEEMVDGLRDSERNSRELEAEERYITGLTDTLEIVVQDGAVDNAREIARTPGSTLRGRAGARALVRYQGGSLTAAEFLDVVRTWNPPYRGQLVAAADEQVEQVLEGVTRNKILVAEASRQGLQVSEVEADSLSDVMQMQLINAAMGAGLTSIQPQDGETMHQAIERKVNAFLEAILLGQQNAFPLGPVSFSLRNQFDGEVFDRSFDAVLARIEAQRPARVEPPAQPLPDTGSGS